MKYMKASSEDQNIEEKNPIMSPTANWENKIRAESQGGKL